MITKYTNCKFCLSLTWVAVGNALFGQVAKHNADITVFTTPRGVKIMAIG